MRQILLSLLMVLNPEKLSFVSSLSLVQPTGVAAPPRRFDFRRLNVPPAIAWVRGDSPRLHDPPHVTRRAGRIHSLLQFLRVNPVLVSFARLLAAISLAAALLVPSPVLAVSGGRMGGSFGPSHAPSSSRSRPHNMPSQPRYAYRKRTATGLGATARPPVTVDVGRGDASVVATGGSTSSAVVTVAFVSIAVLGASSGSSGEKDEDGVPASTVTHLTLALDGERGKPVVSALREMSVDTSRTSTREGVQDLVLQVCRELAKHIEKSGYGCSITHEKCDTVKTSERLFNRISTDERIKFQRELVNNINGVDTSDEADTSASPPLASAGAPSAVIVVLIVATQDHPTLGNGTDTEQIFSIEDAMRALARIASAAGPGGRLMSAEILWAPEGKGEILTRRDVVAYYPKIVPI